MKKRLLTGLTALLICLFPVMCRAQEEKDTLQSGEWEYYLNEDGTATISHWNGKEESLVIPGELDGRTVTVIGKAAFDTCNDLKEVKIPDSVTKIEPSAFSQTGLTGVTIPEGVTEIGDYAFWLCGSLEDVTIPDSVTRIGYMAFTASPLTGVSIPASVEEIGAWAFGSCHVLTDLEVSPDSEYFTVTDHALVETKTNTLNWYPEAVTDAEYKIPEGITKIGSNAFSYCDNLEYVVIPDGVTEIERHAFSSCRNLKDINIPESVEKIGSCAFLCCKNLKQLTVPESVTEIDLYAFDDCENLTLIVTKGSYAEQYAKENEVPYTVR